MTTRRVRRLAVWTALFLPLCVFAAQAKDDPEARRLDWEVYRRDIVGIERAVDHLADEARTRDAKHVLVAFDQITFHPAPGQHEYSDTHDYAGDLPAWLDAIEGWAKRSALDIHVVGTLGPEPIRVGPPAWKHSIQRALGYDWFDDGKFSRFEEAVDWVRRWAPAEDGVLVLVASEFGPERWADDGPMQLGSTNNDWRRKLLLCGRYWDEEAIVKALGRIDCPLLVVAPEVCFGDEIPMPALPALPWASRPQRPAVPLLDLSDLPLPEGLTPGSPGGAGGSPGGPPGGAPRSKEELRKQLDEALKPLYPDDEERKRVVDGLLEGRQPGVPGLPPVPGGPPGRGGLPVPQTPGALPFGGDDAEDEDGEFIIGGRFDSTTPLWFPHYGGTVLLNNHTPSAFGYWPYARVAAATGGRYLSYPFPPAKWLDVCPRDDHQLKRLAPHLVKRPRFAETRASDPALSALAKAEMLVLDDTPWSDGYSTQPSARGWDAFESVRPLKETRGFRRRRNPFDLHLMGTGRQLMAAGRELGDLVEKYDAALKILDRALERIREGKDKKSSPRAIANLRLGRFWFSMSAFHLDALGIYLREIKRFAPPHFKPDQSRLHVTYVPAIKMSDCLDAYDGRSLTAEDEKRYSRWVHYAFRLLGDTAWADGQEVPGQQGNILEIPEHAKDYRAKRARSAVLRHLDERLVPRALDMIQSAEEVMQHHAKTPWGWSTYYAVAYTFIFLPVDPTPGWTNRHGPEGEEEEPPPWTPTPRGGGGSAPGGPVTPPR